MIFARIGNGPCYHHWNEIFAGVNCMLYFIWGQIPMNYELQIDQFQSSMSNTLLFDHQNMI